MATTEITQSYVPVQGGFLMRVDRPDGRAVPIPSDPLVVGRAPGCGLFIDNSTVSWSHAQLTATETGIQVRDLKSRNGTFIEEFRVVEAFLRGTPARVRFGDAVFQYTPGDQVRLDISTADSFGSLRGETPVMRRLFAQLARIASSEHTVLITGETGTCKEVVARAIHDASARAERPFHVIDCGALPASLAESVLFGHEARAFTDAKRHPSPFEEARGGTIFLDEIGELPPDLQVKLLRVLQERKIKALGSNVYHDVDVRIIAATNVNLHKAMNEKTFRSDLYYRLDQLHVQLPPLRDRLDDIPLLLGHFAWEAGCPEIVKRIPESSIRQLRAHEWPGNVRELQDVLVETMVYREPAPHPIHPEKYIGAAVLVAPDGNCAIDCVDPNDSEQDALRRYWTQMFERHESSIRRISFYSGCGRAKVRRMLRKYGLVTDEPVTPRGHGPHPLDGALSPVWASAASRAGSGRTCRGDRG